MGTDPKGTGNAQAQATSAGMLFSTINSRPQQGRHCCAPVFLRGRKKPAFHLGMCSPVLISSVHKEGLEGQSLRRALPHPTSPEPTLSTSNRAHMIILLTTMNNI